jgi:hypothetical protein
MQCAEALRAQAYFDGELDAPSSVDVERRARIAHALDRSPA